MSEMAILRQLCAKVRSETPNAVTNRIWCAMYGLDYEPRNTKEKWLMRIIYLGTIVLVAFFWWEYVKAR